MINLDNEKDRLEHGKLRKNEKDILKNAGITKSTFLSDISTRAMIVNQFINVIKEKKVLQESKLHQSTNIHPTSNPEAEYLQLRKNTITNA